MIGNFKKHSLILTFVICVCLALCLTLFACNGNDGNDESAAHTLTFVADGEVVGTVSGKAGDPITPPSAPAKEDHDFVGWFDDSEFGADAQQAPDVMPDSDATYYAKYVERAHVGYSMEFYLQKLNADKSAALDEYELDSSAIKRFTGSVGSTVTVPERLDYAPEGFVRRTNESEVLSVTLGDDESLNVLKVYFARATVHVNFDGNGGEGEIATKNYPYGVRLQNKFDNAFTRAGYRFAGFDSRYANGDAIPANGYFEITGDVTVTAQWHKEFAPASGEGDKIYYDGERYYRLQSGETPLYAENRASGIQLGREYDEFSFDGTDGEQICRVYDGDSAYETCGDETGVYARYDHALREYTPYVLALNGFGYATFSEIQEGSVTRAIWAGTYQYVAEHRDYDFTIIDPLTNQTEGKRYFKLLAKPDGIQNEEIVGSFILEGLESGEYAGYDVRSSSFDDDKMLQLFGDGTARMVTYTLSEDGNSLTATQLSQGSYFGTDNYEDEFGEWRYVPEDGSGFDFVLTTASDEDGETVYVYMAYDEALNVTLNEESGKGGKLELGGYNAAVYTVGGTTSQMSGAIAFEGDTLRFTPYDEYGAPQPPILFNVDLTARTFELNSNGLWIENNILKGFHTGFESPIVVIPDGVTSVEDEAFKGSAIDITHVTVPASVTHIGARAFQNSYSLMSVTFEGSEPIDIDWSAANDPFRWPMEGEFKIFVPHASLEAYRSAWTACEYKITSVIEDSNKPLYEVEDGVLISYNNKDAQPQNVAVALPDEALSVAPDVFKNLTYIVSVDLNKATSVGSGAFEGCSGLTSLTASKLEEIGAAAFSLCTSLESVELPAIRAIGEQAFASCAALVDVSLGKNIERIGDRAFFGCAEHPLELKLALAADSEVPIMGTLVFGIATYRVSVETVEDALALYDGSGRGWSKYASRVTVREGERSAIAGEWVNVATLTPASIGGRLELAVEGEVLVYSLDGTTLTLYSYNSDNATYSTVVGSYANDRVSFAINGASYVLTRAKGTLTYTTSKGEALVVDLDTYEAGQIVNEDGTLGNYRVSAHATFDGAEGELIVTGSSVTMSDLTEQNATIGDINFGEVKRSVRLGLSSDGSCTCTSEYNDIRGPYTADDGSEIRLEIYGKGTSLLTSVCLTGKLTQIKNKAGEVIEVTTRGTWPVLESPAKDVYVVSYNYLSDRYFITVSLDEATKTFTYSCDLAASRVVLNGAGGRVVVLLDKDGKTIQGMSLLFSTADGSESLYVRSFELQSDGSYIVEAEQRVMVYDPSTGASTPTLGELSGVYELMLDFDSGTCTVTKIGALPKE